jgi:hypothetical protein
MLYVLAMGRIEFPTPINANTARAVSATEQSGYIQSTLEGTDLEQSAEIELGNCVVTAPVKFRKLIRGNELHCTMQVEPDLLHPEQEGLFEAYAYHEYADMAKDARLRHGNRAVM